jgi:hypothetical protein
MLLDASLSVDLSEEAPDFAVAVDLPPRFSF